MSDPSEDGPDAAAAAVFEKIASALEPTEVSQAHRMSMRRRIREHIAQRLPAGMTTLRAAEGEWLAISPLVQMKLLRVDPAGGTQTVLIRAAAGGILPRHRHSKDEELVVLEGECRIGAQRLVAGDAHFASAGSWHEDITTETGVLVLLRGEYPAPAHV
jgi:quercetin dioxygenase-like cupin family protein